MVFGLLLSTLGNNTVEYGFNALTAAGVVSVGALLTLSALRRLSAFAFPVIAKLMGKHSPDKVLIACDSTETVLSVLAPHHHTPSAPPGHMGSLCLYAH